MKGKEGKSKLLKRARALDQRNFSTLTTQTIQINHGNSIPYLQQEMQNRIQHQIGQSSCCPSQLLDSPVVHYTVKNE